MLGGAGMAQKTCNSSCRVSREGVISTCEACKLFQVRVLMHVWQCVLRLEGREICQASHGLNVLLRDCKASLGTENQRLQLGEVTQGLCQI